MAKKGIDKGIMAEAVEMYKQGIKAKEIADTYGFNVQTLYNNLDKAGVSRQHPKKSSGIVKTINTGGVKKCPKCGYRNNPKKAKFCCMCGADIRNNIDILIEKLQTALSNTCYLPDSVQRETADTIREAMLELQKR